MLTSRLFRREKLVCVFVVLAAVAHAAHAQSAWVGDPKSLTASFSYAYVPSSAVVDNPDKSFPDVPTSNHLFTLGAEYVPIENLSFGIELPLAMVQYAGDPVAMPHMPVRGAWDDGEYHTTLTDVRAAVAYQLLDEPYVAVTPFAAFSTPVMDYEVNGFATGGRYLTQGHFGVGVGRTLDPILPSLYAMASYEFTLSQPFDATPLTADHTQNRSDVEAQIGYFFLGGTLVLNVAGNWRKHHGGIEFANFANETQEERDYHDAILAEEYLFLGGGASYSITTRFTISAAVRFFILGYNTRDQNSYGIDLAYRIL